MVLAMTIEEGYAMAAPSLLIPPADATTIDTVSEGGIFGYTPLLTGGGMEFVARTTKPSTLIRLPGAPVRARAGAPAEPRSAPLMSSPGLRPRLCPSADRPPV